MALWADTCGLPVGREWEQSDRRYLKLRSLTGPLLGRFRIVRLRVDADGLVKLSWQDSVLSTRDRPYRIGRGDRD